MPNINQLSQAPGLSGSDQLVVWSTNNGDTYKLPVSVLLAHFQKTFAAPQFATQVYTPGTGFSIAVADNGNNQWIILQPVGPLASGTITLPSSTVAADGQEFMLNTTQSVAAFTIQPNGASFVYGYPRALQVGDCFRLRFYRPNNAWYLVS